MKNILARAASLGLGLGVLFLLPLRANAYNINVHYEITELLASACGLPHAKLIAWADARVDRDVNTRAEVPYNFTAREQFHFRTTAQPPRPVYIRGVAAKVTDYVVVHGSREAAAIVDKAIDYKDADPVLLGIGLHAYQDSWSHEGNEPIWGHLFEFAYPDNPVRDPDKALEMSEATWEKLDRWSRAKEGRACEKSWPELRDEALKLLRSEDDLRAAAGDFSSEVKREQAQADFTFWAEAILYTDFIPR